MILDLGIIDYGKAYIIQKEFVEKRKSGAIEDSLIIAEHPNVFTIGRTGKRENLLADEGFLLNEGVGWYNADRGGDITFHGPGQLVVYPIINLKEHVMDLHKYLRDLEETAIGFLEKYSVKGIRVAGRTGVWTDSGKIAFIGIAASNWITYHGLSININTDMKYFSMIHPCGMKDIRVTSLKDILKKAVEMREAKVRIAEKFEEIFRIPVMA